MRILEGLLPPSKTPIISLLDFIHKIWWWSFQPFLCDEQTNLTYVTFSYCIMYCKESQIAVVCLKSSLISQHILQSGFLLLSQEGCKALQSACMSVCLLTCLKNNMTKLHDVFCTCYLQSWWLGPSPTTMQCLCTSGLVDDIMFSHRAPHMSCTVRLTAEGCQSSVFQLLPSLLCLPPTDIPWS